MHGSADPELGGLRCDRCQWAFSLSAAQELDHTMVPQTGGPWPLAQCTAQTSINLGPCCQVADVGPLAQCTDLISLDLRSCGQVVDIGSLPWFAAPTSLNVSGCSKPDQRQSAHHQAALQGLKSVDVSSIAVANGRGLLSWWHVCRLVSRR